MKWRFWNNCPKANAAGETRCAALLARSLPLVPLFKIAVDAGLAALYSHSAPIEEIEVCFSRFGEGPEGNWQANLRRRIRELAFPQPWHESPFLNNLLRNSEAAGPPKQIENIEH